MSAIHIDLSNDITDRDRNREVSHQSIGSIANNIATVCGSKHH
jgi:hypothetical protein